MQVFESPEEVDAATIERVPLWNDKRDEHGPFDIIGDVHGCCDELEQLLADLGYEPGEMDADDPVWGRCLYAHPQGRKAIFLGDLVDRGSVANLVGFAVRLSPLDAAAGEPHAEPLAVMVPAASLGFAVVLGDR